MTQERESEQRIWMAVALSVAVYFGWTTIFPPPKPLAKLWSRKGGKREHVND